MYGKPEESSANFVLNRANFYFMNLLQTVQRTVTRLKKASGSKKLHSICSGNIRPVWQTLPLIGWDQRQFSCGWGRNKNKNGWQCWYFTGFKGNWPICRLVEGTARSPGPKMILGLVELSSIICQTVQTTFREIKVHLHSIKKQMIHQTVQSMSGALPVCPIKKRLYV